VSAYIRSGGFGEILTKYLKTFSGSHVMEHSSELTEAFHKSVLPALWFRTDTHLSQNHDAVFRLLYHGIVPDVLEMIVGSLLALKGMKRKFQTFCDPILTHIHSLQLADCLVLPFGKKLLNPWWIGSNKYGFGRLLPYLVVHLRGIIHDNLNELQSDKVENSRKVCLGICRLVQSMFAMISQVMHRSPSRNLVMELDKIV
jgi:hypothetical protein